MRDIVKGTEAFAPGDGSDPFGSSPGTTSGGSSILTIAIGVGIIMTLLALAATAAAGVAINLSPKNV